MFNIDSEFIERLKDDGHDLWTIGQWQHWLDELPAMAGAVDQMRSAFHGVELGDGIGIHEANGLDDYADESELARLRALDERQDWQNLDADTLEHFYSAPSFFDSQGFVFHLPAFLIATLDDKHEFGFIDRIVDRCGDKTGGWIDLITPQQAGAIASILSLVKQHPDYYNDSEKFELAITRFSTIANNGG